MSPGHPLLWPSAGAARIGAPPTVAKCGGSCTVPALHTSNGNTGVVTTGIIFTVSPRPASHTSSQSAVVICTLSNLPSLPILQEHQHPTPSHPVEKHSGGNSSCQESWLWLFFGGLLHMNSFHAMQDRRLQKKIEVQVLAHSPSVVFTRWAVLIRLLSSHSAPHTIDCWQDGRTAVPIYPGSAAPSMREAEQQSSPATIAGAQELLASCSR